MPLDSTPHLPEETETEAEAIRKRFAEILRACPYPKGLDYLGRRGIGASQPREVCAVGALLLGTGSGEWTPSRIFSDEMALMPASHMIWDMGELAGINMVRLVSLNNTTDLTFDELADRLEHGEI